MLTDSTIFDKYTGQWLFKDIIPDEIAAKTYIAANNPPRKYNSTTDTCFKHREITLQPGFNKKNFYASHTAQYDISYNQPASREKLSATRTLTSCLSSMRLLSVYQAAMEPLCK